jgi:uncharacterized protein (DUF58 family)
MAEVAKPTLTSDARGQSATSADPMAAVRATLPSLIQLNSAAAGLTLRPNIIGAQKTGDYLSPFKGRGMEFAESRPYEPGDDARNLHWRVMARTGKPFSKQFREERERPVLIWLDLRSRMFFGTRVAFKSVIAARSAALIAWAASLIGDRIGGVIFSADMHFEIKPRRGKSAVLYLLRRITEHPAWETLSRAKGRSKTDSRERTTKPASSEDAATGNAQAARDAMIRLRRVARPGSRIILISDFADFDAVTESNLARLARHSEVTMLQIYDPLEASLPPPGHYRLSDGDDEFVLDAADPHYREAYAEQFSSRVEQLRAFARRNRISYIACRTDQNPATLLRHELGRRRSS